MADLTSALVDFCTMLRDEHGVPVGRDATHDALLAAALLGLEQRPRLKAMLRAICCKRLEHVPVFNALFDEYFDSGVSGVPQPKRARKRRPDDRGASPEKPRDSSYQLAEESATESWMALRARYSPAEGASTPPAIPLDGYGDADALVRRLIRSLPLGRSRRLRTAVRGRIDLRRTVRSSLQTGGELLKLRRREPPLQNPRFVILIDASRSMSEHAPAALQVAHALVRRTRRASAFAFSTSLREITRELRAIRLHGDRHLMGIGEAWGGGTKIGANLKSFVRNFARKIDSHTYVIIVSDGLDVGEIADLRRAMRNIASRAAGVVWVNPHAAEPGFEPTAGGMMAVLPYLDSLTAWKGLADA